MASERASRPRTLSAVFGVYFLLMAMIAWYSGQTLGYRYSIDVTRYTFTIYLVAAAVFLVGVIVAAVLAARSLDNRIERLESSASPNEEAVEEVVVEEETPDAVPPPLEESVVPTGDHVDRDIDELLVSLQEMEQEAGTAENVEPVEAPASRPRSAQPAAGPRFAASAWEDRRLSALRKKRDRVVAYFAGPALASIGAIGISAAMLPGSDAFLQTSYQLNTSLLLGLGYSFVGIAAYVAASVLLAVRAK